MIHDVLGMESLKTCGIVKFYSSIPNSLSLQSILGAKKT